MTHQILSQQLQVPMIPMGDATELRWELNEDLDRCVVSFPIDQ